MAKGLSQTVENLNFPLAKGKKPKEIDAKPAQETRPADSGLNARIKEAIALPMADRDEYWHIEDLSKSTKNEGMIKKLLKRKELSPDEINDLKKEAIQSPGNTRAKIQKLKKQFPNNSELYMLSAICTNGMLMNSSNRDEVFRGLKFATREAATSLMSNGISLYNCESFFKIYFVMLERLKRAQLKALGMISEDPRLLNSKNSLKSAIKVVDYMSAEKSKVSNVINHLKKKLKSSNYIALFDPMDIRDAAHKIEKGVPKEASKFGTAAEMISYVYAFGMTFAHTPLLSKLVDKLLALLPDKDVSIFARKISINSIRRFGNFKIAAIEGERDEMIRVTKTILKENLMGISKLGGQSIYQSYEADLFLNIAYIAELTPSLLEPREHAEVNDKAIQAMEMLAEKDMSKGNLYTESANNHLRRLSQLKDERAGGVQNDDD